LDQRTFYNNNLQQLPLIILFLSCRYLLMVWLCFLQVSSVLLWWWFFIEFIFKSFCYQHWCQWGTIEVKTLSEKTGLIWFISYYIILFIDNNIVRVWVSFLILVNWNQSDTFPFQFSPKEKATVATVATLFGGGGLETMMEIIIVSGGKLSSFSKRVYGTFWTSNCCWF